MPQDDARKPERRPRDYKREMEQRAEQLEDCEHGDELIGQWPKLDMEAMDQAFKTAIVNAMKRGQ